MKKMIFLHIEKTGGVSMRHALAEAYRGHVAPVPHHPDSTYAPPYPTVRISVAEWMERAGELVQLQHKLIMGHFDRACAVQFPDWGVFVMLRHPVRQLLSMYLMHGRAGDVFPDAHLVATMTFEQWLEQYGERFANMQTRSIVGCSSSAERFHADDAQFLLASQGYTIGITERMDETVQVVNRRFGLNMSMPERINAAQVDTRHYAISPETWERVLALQWMDMQVYAEALTLFERQFHVL